MSVASFALLLAASGPVAGSVCSTFVGHPVQARPFEDIAAGLPKVADRGPYESTAEYRQRLAGAASAPQQAMIVRISSREGEGLSYDPDRQILTVYPSAFGVGEVNFSDVVALRSDDTRSDNFSGAIGFLVSATETGRETYQATNAFGARLTVTRVKRRVSAIWKGPGKMGQSQFVGVGAFKPVAQLRIGPDAARQIVEGGGGAILFTAKPPFHSSGTSTLEASFSRPEERVDAINVIVADVRCAFLLERNGTVVHALDVR
jgi:hypothetical protein